MSQENTRRAEKTDRSQQLLRERLTRPGHCQGNRDHTSIKETAGEQQDQWANRALCMSQSVAQQFKQQFVWKGARGGR